jgi:hypothetical protein
LYPDVAPLGHINKGDRVGRVQTAGTGAHLHLAIQPGAWRGAVPPGASNSTVAPDGTCTFNAAGTVDPLGYLGARTPAGAQGDVDGDGRADLCGFVDTGPTGSGKAEIHCTSASSNFATFNVHAATGFSLTTPADSARWRFSTGGGMSRAWTRQMTIQSLANNQYVSAELNYSGGDYGMLRARASTASGWERFLLVGDCASSSGCAIQSLANNQYVSAELNYSGGDYGMLRARSSTASGWEWFRITS